MEYTLKYVEFKKDFLSEVEPQAGIYQIIALPFSEKISDCNIGTLNDYVDYCQNFYLHSWEDKVKSTTNFKDRIITVDLNDFLSTHVEKSNNYIMHESKSNLHDFFIDFLPFLPSLYIGISDNIQDRFRQHTNINDDGSTLYKLTNNRDYTIFKNCKKYFIWKVIPNRNLDMFSTEYRDVLEEFERVMIQTKKPLINKVKRK